MIDLIKDALGSPAGSFAFVFALLILAFVLVWKLSHFTTKFSSVEKLEGNIDTIKQDIHSIKAFIQIFRESNNPLAQRQSPVSLTETGKKVAEELNVNTMIVNHWEDFNRSVTKQLKDDCNPYDIQVASFKIGDKYQEYLNEEEINKIKNHAFLAGYNLDVYNLLFGILIRNKILQDRGYKSTDVDKFDPNKNPAE
ncbi:hypothetical protein GN157_05615 [Flavobacterium rakeshii]|uniref:Uncharacterized protein n=1 Tax=Flavobacterium rakeshii TaxID=1038845 RepID=A0A6N8HA58_9FLAO|nr:hypothetical protein [Flavobacterium rakeshii]MUV03182.1 hypothetical protein [Flavobacterium rakeshii]